MKTNTHATDLLRSLLNKRQIGGRHTEERNVLKRIDHLPRDEQKTTLEDWETYVSEGYVIRLKKTGEWHVSLNPHKLKEIWCLIEEQEKE